MKNLVATLLILFGFCFTLPGLASAIVDQPEWNPVIDTDRSGDVIAIDGIDITLTTYDASSYLVNGASPPPSNSATVVAGPMTLAAAPFEVGWRSLDIS